MSAMSMSSAMARISGRLASVAVGITLLGAMSLVACGGVEGGAGALVLRDADGGGGSGATADVVGFLDVASDVASASQDVAMGDLQGEDGGGALGFDIPEDLAITSLSVMSIAPNSGPTTGGTLVMLNGSGFTGGLEIRFGDAAGSSLFVVDERYATCTTPAHSAGEVSVIVVRPEDGAEASLPGGFVFEDRLGVASIDPDEGGAEGGEPFTLSAEGLTRDAVVAIGGRLALSVVVQDDHTATGLTPPGRPGLADVTVLTHDGEAVLSGGYRYRVPAALDRVEPPVGATVGGEVVTLVGAGLFSSSSGDRPVSVWFGDALASNVRFSVEGDRLDVRTPPGVPGAVDVRVVMSSGDVTLLGGFTYVEPAFVAGTFGVHALSPARGSVEGGEAVVVVATGLRSGETPSVRFGGEDAIVQAYDPAGATILTMTPPCVPPSCLPGSVDVSVAQASRTATLADGFRYESILLVDRIEPSSGSASGGDLVTIRGEGFEPGASLRIGALPAVDVEVVDGGTVTARTPQGSPGPADVVVSLASGAREARLVGGFEYTTGATALLAVEPNLGAQAGGTRVRLWGVGLPESPVVTIGGVPCRDVERVSSVEVVAWTPKGAPGSFDVVLSGADGASVALQDGFTYFDPTQRAGGTWGRPIDGSVNVTVLEGNTGYGLEGAFVILGDDPTTPYQALTDDRGQLTFSGPGLRGPVEVSASKAGYAAYSVVEFDAENVTVWLQQMAPPGGGVGGGGSVARPPGKVLGRVLNADKYLLIPAGRCADMSLTEPPLCLPCTDDRDCGSGHRCTLIGDTGRFCTRACTTGADCPAGYLCRDVGPDSSAQCIPHGGDPHIYCRQADPSLFGGAPRPGPFGEVNQHHEYMIETDLGELAVYCVAGVRHRLTGQFEPLIMGVRRHLLVPRGQPLSDVDVMLDIPLERDLTLIFSQLPEHPAGLAPPNIRAGIELGSDGYILVDTAEQAPELRDDGLVARLPRQPKMFSGALFDASYTFYVTITADTETRTPASYFYRRGAAVTDDDRLLHRDPDGVWSAVATGVVDDLAALWGPAPDDLFAAGTDGHVYHLGPAGWTEQPVPAGPALNDIAGVARDDVWAVGDRGRILHFNGVFWEAWPTLDERSDLVAVAAAASDYVFAISRGGGVLRYDGATWRWVLEEGGPRLFDVWAAAPDDVWVVGEGGVAMRYDGQAWHDVFVPTTRALRAIHGLSPDDAFAVGDEGFIFRWDGRVWTPVPSGTDERLRDLRVMGPAEAIAVGDDGCVRHWDGVAWRGEAQELNIRRHLYRVWVTQDDGVWALGPRGVVIGPFMGFPFFTQPAAGGVIASDDLTIRWMPSGRTEPTFNYLTLADPSGMPFWTMILDGDRTSFQLPKLEELVGEQTIPTTALRLTLTRALNPAFHIDRYRSRDLSSFRRSTWSTVWIDATAAQ